MGYFPFYADISGRSCIIAGGGEIALRKAEKLTAFEPEITVIAPEISRRFDGLKVRRIERTFRDSDIDGAFMVIAATGDSELNRHISELCRAKKIPVNSVDDIENCSFIFPALVHKDDITIGISTGGSSPVMAKYLRRLIERELNGKLTETAKLLKKYRPEVEKRFDTETQRREVLEELLEICLGSENLPGSGEIEEILEKRYEDKNRYSQKCPCNGTDQNDTV